MRNAFLVAWREYAENAKTKGFWIGIFMLPLILFLSAYVPVLLEKKGRPQRHFVLLDFSREFERSIEAALAAQHDRDVARAFREYVAENARDRSATNVIRWLGQSTNAQNVRVAVAELKPELRSNAPPFVEPARTYNRVTVPEAEGQEETVAGQKLRTYLRGEELVDAEGQRVRLDAAIVIPREISATNKVQYWSANLADKGLQNLVQEALNRELRQREYGRRGLDVAAFRQVEAIQAPIEELNPRKEEGKETVSQVERLAQWAPVGFVYLLWVAIFSISQMLLNNTIEEKSNRIIEVLLSSVTPAEYILGKLGGIAAVGLTMVGAWIGSLLGVVLWSSSKPGNAELARNFLELLSGSHLLIAFVVYFFFGYLLYAALILAIGSVCNTIKEAQNYMATITMLMMVPLLTMMFIPKDPNGTIATVLSWIPIYTPFIMMNRAAAQPPLFDLAGTMILLIVSTGVALWMAVRIFRTGILRTGQPPRLVEMLRWVTGK